MAPRQWPPIRAVPSAHRRMWLSARDIRLLAQAAKHGIWNHARGALPALRRRLHRAVFPSPAALLSSFRNMLQARGATLAFVGFDNPSLRERVERDLAPAFPAGVTTIEHGYSERLRGRRVAVLFDPPTPTARASGTASSSTEPKPCRPPPPKSSAPSCAGSKVASSAGTRMR